MAEGRAFSPAQVRAHMIKGNEGCGSPQQIIAVGISTTHTKISEDRIEYKLAAVAAIHRRRRVERKTTSDIKHYGLTADQFWTWLFHRCKSKGCYWVVADDCEHVMSVLGGWERMREWGGNHLLISLDVHRRQYAWGKDGVTIRWICLRNIYYCGLRELRGMFAPKGHEPQPPGKNPKSKVARAEQKAELTLQAIQAWADIVREQGWGKWRTTLAGQSWSAWRHKYYEHPIYTHGKPNVCALEREAYRGGLCRALKTGELSGPQWTALDIRSCYPWIMATRELPYTLHTTGRELSLGALTRLMAQYDIIAEVLLQTDSPDYLVRRPSGNICPTGVFEALLCTPELRHALRHKRVLRVRRYALYKRAVLFNGFCISLHALREKYRFEGNAAYEYITKLLLNSLYGRFALSCWEWEFVGDHHFPPYDSWECLHVDTGEIRHYRSIGGVVERRLGRREGGDTLVAIPALVTAYARMHLISLIELAHRDNVAYCDTDSLIVSPTGLAYLQDQIGGTGLGSLRITDQSDYLVIRGEKQYMLGSSRKIAGVKADAEAVGNNRFQQWKQQGIKGCSRMKQTPAARADRIAITLAPREDEILLTAPF